jgi:hypothetical protein
MLTVMVVLVLAAFALVIAEAMGRAPGWASKLVICVILLLMILPK